MTAEVVEASHDLSIAERLAKLGVPLFIAAVDEHGKPHPPAGWQKTQPGEASLKAIRLWQPGMALCAVQGVVTDVLDRDPQNGGDWASLTTSLAQHEGDDTPTIALTRTPSGGEHAWVWTLGLRKQQSVVTGIDYQAGAPDGSGRGFVFIPPTVRPSKITGEPHPYVWDIEPPRAVTGASQLVSQSRLRKYLVTRQATSLSPSEPGYEPPLGVPLTDAVFHGDVAPGEQDVALSRYAWKLASRGLSDEEAFFLWQVAVERLRSNGLEDAGRPWSAEDFHRHIAGARRKAALGVDPEMAVWARAQDGAGEDGWLDVADLRTDTTPALVDELLYAQSVSMWHAPPGFGKTALMLDLALSVGTGVEFLSRQVASGPVLYVYSEGSTRLQKRVKAWLQGHGLGDGLEQLRGRVLFWPHVMRLTEDAALALAVKAREAGAGLVVFDNLMTGTAGSGASMTEDAAMSESMKALWLCASQSGSHIAVVHHDNRAGSFFGSAVLDGWLDARFHITRPEEGNALLAAVVAEKQRDEAHGEVARLQTHVAVTGQRVRPDGSMRDESSIWLEPLPPGEGAGAGTGLGTDAGLAAMAASVLPHESAAEMRERLVRSELEAMGPGWHTTAALEARPSMSHIAHRPLLTALDSLLSAHHIVRMGAFRSTAWQHAKFVQGGQEGPAQTPAQT